MDLSKLRLIFITLLIAAWAFVFVEDDNGTSALQRSISLITESEQVKQSLESGRNLEYRLVKSTRKTFGINREAN